MIFIDEFQIAVAATYDKWIIAMEESLAAITDGSVKVPRRTNIDLGKDTLLLMPAIGKDYFATKLVTFFPNNSRENKPSIYGTLILNDRNTGEPLAVIDGSKLTAMRTAAVSAIGIKSYINWNHRCWYSGISPGSFCLFSKRYLKAVCL
jgi:ornithine cyclodeaminase/alanine dehydrogenase-like protein (mu-crystallin family)